jgi:hypothetical protein
MDKAAELPRKAQEEIAREVLERVNRIEQMRAALKVGVIGLEAGLGQAIDARAILERAHRVHGKD